MKYAAILILAAAFSSLAIAENASEVSAQDHSVVEQAIETRLASQDCCWMQVDLDRSRTLSRESAVGPECCWVPVWWSAQDN